MCTCRKSIDSDKRTGSPSASGGHIGISAHLHIILFAVLLYSFSTHAQGVEFELKTSPTVDFTFNTIQKYQNGIIIHDAVVLDVVAAGTQWDMYIGTSTSAAGTFDNVQYYSNIGD